MKYSFDDTIKFTEDVVHRLHATHVGPDMIEHVSVEVYGSQMTIAQVASVASGEARQLNVSPWDKSAIGAIEKGLHAANLGAGIVNDGTMVRVTFPPLTEERRKQLVKELHQLLEDGHIHVRQDRENYLKQIKQLPSEEDQKREKDFLQKAVDQANAKLDELGQKKEKELMTV